MSQCYKMGALKLLYFDCFSGASGDMILGALIDAGVTLDDLRGALGKLAIHADIIWTEPVVRAGIRATKFQVRGEHGPADEDHDRYHHHEVASAAVHRHASESSIRHQADSHPHASEGSYRPDSGSHPHAAVPLRHRTLAEVFHLIDASGLSGPSKDRAKHLFTVLGEAEAAIHGTSLDRVHLHEVGALDSIIDIVGTVFALERLGVDRIHSSPLNVGGGTIRSAHGRYPVPAPATMRLLKGVPVYAGPAESVELVTPTGALLVAGYASEFGALPPMRVERIGYGAGARDLPHSPNVLRVLIGESDAAAPSQSVVVIEAEIDDMNPQLFGAVMDRLLAEGALDVFYTPIQMKKNRPGTLMTVIAKPVERERLTATIFRETTTIGVRYREMARDCLERDVVTVDTAVGPVRVKVARRDGRVFNVSPEFDDCVRLAQQHGRPVKEIQALAATAFLSR